MPVIESTYKAPFLFKNGFIATVYSGLFRRVNNVVQERQRITLSDGDFIDLDWCFSKEKTDKLIILLHGLEGDSKRPYMLGAAKLFNNNNIDALCVNFRGCSGEDNLKLSSYHSGATEDLHEVIEHVISTKSYANIYLKGISLGANMILKFLGEGNSLPHEIKAAVCVSVPCDLNGSCKELHKIKNLPYAIRFLNHLKRRLTAKMEKFPEAISGEVLKNIKTLRDFDDVYTSKIHGFKDALDYYQKCSGLQFITNIKIPTLIINALNDSFLSPECYPVKEAKSSEYIYLEMPTHGGHVAFIDKKNVYYNERRALEFINSSN
ncbi:alpha/beta fold hydrolase [Seonamhaeicola sediminis]|uniref:Alpha/beta fold hydrolase n=1 Tax=Seonamhaeicola sediminis TaxID=2528206 RepID=A0A562YDG6_9FLAO|nr:alpha/beta fold hydrolase [Seonamhaeicola sediminis]TWO32691.1 alpha/beta fold hydrolase [Seonamhaeicola sediminis]